MFLRDFAEQRGVKADTVAAYIREHEEEFAGHTWMEGKQKVLDDVAVELLDKKYPMPKPIQVIQDAEAREQLSETRQALADARAQNSLLYEQILATKDENLKLTMQAAKVAFLEAAAEDREVRIQDLAAQLQKSQEATLDEQAARHAVELENERLRAELKAEKAKTWWQKLCGR